MICSGCGRSCHVNLDETWTRKGSLTRTSWTPFDFAGKDITEGFCASCKSSNNSLSEFQWTKIGNVTPRDQLWKQAIVKDVSHRVGTCGKCTGKYNPSLGCNCGHVKENFYQTGAFQWTKIGNVTPRDQLWKQAIVKDVSHRVGTCGKCTGKYNPSLGCNCGHVKENFYQTGAFT